MSELRPRPQSATTTTHIVVASIAVAGVLLATSARAQLPPVVAPAENPVTEAKRVLGKILFWDEQLSSDDSVACGTCHIPSSGGGDPRIAVHPGVDGAFGTADDVRGSFGVVRRDEDGNAIDDPTFGFEPQVTGRAAPSNFASVHAPELFWDGRASSIFTDPLDASSVLIPSGGALESQAVGPILSSVEMAKDGRTWDEVVAKLAFVRPLRLADDVPADAAAAIAARPSYGELFAEAFGDEDITPARIAFAIATYERTLLANETPWDRFMGGDGGAMTAAQVRGWNLFRGQALCSRCHVPPLFTNNDFLNIGVRPASEDEGRMAVSGLGEDFGDMKVPGLRGVGLRETLMHTGGIDDVDDALDFYVQAGGHRFFTADLDTIPPDGTPMTAIRIPRPQRGDLLDFVANALTDPRVASETFPFDRPGLASEAGPGVERCSHLPAEGCYSSLVDGASPFRVTDSASGDDGDRIDWKLLKGEAAFADDFGDPTGDEGLVLCVYQGEDPALVFEGRAPADGSCADGTCWKRSGPAAAPSGYKYKSKSGAPDGVRKITVKTATEGRSKVVVKAKGAEIATSPFGFLATPAATPLTVQLQSAAGGCWSMEYGGADTNEAGRFEAR